MDIVTRLLHWKRGESIGPMRLHLVMTERCNLRCLSCFMGQIKAKDAKKTEVPDEVLVALVRDAVRLGVEEVYLVGGEVFVRRSLALELMGIIKEAGLFGDLTTNGTRLNSKTVQRIVEMGWDRLQISLDGPTAEVNDSLRPPDGTFGKITAGLRRLRWHKKRLGTDKPRVSVSTVLSNRNWNHLTELVDVAADHGAAEVTFQSLKDMSEICDDLQLGETERAELDREVLSAQQRAGERGVLTNVGNFRQQSLVDNIGALDVVMQEDVHEVENRFLGSHCFVPWTQMVVHVNGQVSPCWEWNGKDLGNVKEARLEEIWHGSVFRRWRKNFIQRKVPSFCAQCCLGFVDHTRWVRMTALLAEGEDQEALGIAEGILAENPCHRDALDTKARALFALGRLEEGEAWLRLVIGEERSGLLSSFLLHLLTDVKRFDAALELADVMVVRAGAAEEPSGAAVAALARAVLGAESPAPPGRGSTPLPDEMRHAVLPLLQARIRGLFGGGRTEDARTAVAGVLATAHDVDLELFVELLDEASLREEWALIEQQTTLLLGRLPVPWRCLRLRGKARSELGDVAGAIADLEACLEEPDVDHPRDGVHGTLAEQYFLHGDHEQALFHAEASLAIRPGRNHVLEIQCRALFKLGRFEEVEGAVRACLETAPPLWFLEQAYLLNQLCDAGKHELALELTDSLLARATEPDVIGGEPVITVARGVTEAGPVGPPTGALGKRRNPMLTLVRARMRSLIALGREGQAWGALERTLLLVHDGDLADAAKLLFEVRRVDAWPVVEQLASLVLERLPGQAYALWARGAARGYLSRAAEAETDLLACLAAPAATRAEFEDEVHDTLAELFIGQRRFERAIEHADKALAIRPDKTVSLEHRSRALFALGRDKEGEDAIRRCVARTPDSHLLQCAFLLHLLCDAGRFATALELAVEMRSRLGDDTVLGATEPLEEELDATLALLRSHIRALHGTGDPAGAEATLYRVIEGANAGNLPQLATLLSEGILVQRWAPVIEAADAILRRSPQLPYALWARGTARLNGGSLQEAGADLERCASLLNDPSVPFAAAVHDSLAELALEQGKILDALSHAEAAVALEPNRGLSLVLRCRALMALGRVEEAETAIRRCVETAPSDAALHMSYQLVLLNEATRYSAAHELAQQMLKSAVAGSIPGGAAAVAAAALGEAVPAGPVTLGNQRGPLVTLVRAEVMALHGLGRPTEGHALLERVLALLTGADLAEAVQVLFEVHRQGDWTEAARLADAVLSREPTLTYARWLLGAARGKLGLVEEAIADLEACLAAPGDTLQGFTDAIHDSLAELLLQQGLVEPALLHAEQALSLKPDKAQSLELKARALFALGRADEAEEAIRCSVERAPSAWFLQQSYLLGLLCDVGRHEAALDLSGSMLARIRREGPPDAPLRQLVEAITNEELEATVIDGSLGALDPVLDLLRSRIRALQGVQQAPQARRLLAHVLAIIPRADLAVVSPLIFEIHRQRRWPDVVELATVVLGRSPDDVYCRWVRGAALGKLGSSDRAIEDLRVCLDLDPTGTRGPLDAVHDTLAEIYLDLGDYPRAIEHADLALAARPDKVQSLELKARTLFALGRVAEGEALVRSCVSGSPPGRELEPAFLMHLLGDAGRHRIARELTHKLLERLASTPGSVGPVLAGVARAVLDGTEVTQHRPLGPALEPVLALLRAQVRARFALGDDAGGSLTLTRALLALADEDLPSFAPLLFEAHRREAWTGVVQLTTSILERLPEQAYSLWLRGAALAKLGQLGPAIEDLHRCLDLPARGDVAESSIHDALAEIHLAQGEYEAAIEHAEHALAIQPDEVWTLQLIVQSMEYKARALFALGRAEEAEQAIQACLAAAPDDGFLIQVYLIDLLSDAGRHRASLELADAMLARVLRSDTAVYRPVQALAGAVSAPAEVKPTRRRPEPLGKLRDPAMALVRARVRALFALGYHEEGRQALLSVVRRAAKPDLERAAELVFEPHRHDQWATAEELASAVLRRSPGQPFCLWVRGAARVKLGRVEAAITDLQACLLTDTPARTGFEDAVHDTLAELLARQGEHEQAVTHARQALAIRPGKAESMEILARSLFALGRIEEAERSIADCVASAPLGSYLRQAFLLNLLGDASRHRTALRLSEEMLRRCRSGDVPGGPGVRELARAALGESRPRVQRPLGESEEALLALSRARLRALFATGPIDTAVQGLAAVLEAVPSPSCEAASRLLMLAHERERWSDVVTLASTMMDPQPIAYALWIRGAARGKLGQLDAGIRDLDACLAMPPETHAGFDDAVHDSRAELLLDQGDYAGALASAQRAIQLDPHRVLSMELKVRALFALGDVDRGERSIEAFVEAAPPNWMLRPAHLLASLNDEHRYSATLAISDRMLLGAQRAGQGNPALAAMAAIAKARHGKRPPRPVKRPLGDHQAPFLTLIRNRVVALYGLGRARAAGQLIGRVMSATHPRDLPPAATLLYEVHRQGQTADAVRLASISLDRLPGQPYALWVRGAAHGKLGHDAAATRDLTACLNADRDTALDFADAIHDTLAEQALGRGDYGDALEHADRALALRPGKTQSLVIRARALLAMGAVPRAERSIRACVDSSAAGDILGTAVLLEMLCDAHRPSTALELSRQVLERPDLGGGNAAVLRVASLILEAPARTSRTKGRAPSLGTKRGSMMALVRCRLRALYRLGRHGDGDTLLARVLAAVAAVDLADAASLLREPFAAGRWTVAHGQAAAVLRSRPELVFPRWIRGATRVKLGQFEGAARDLAACLLTPSEAHAELEDAIHDTLAELALERGDYAAALHHADRALALRPGKTQSQALRGRALLATGAVSRAERLIHTCTTSASAMDALGTAPLLEMLCDAGRPATAEELSRLLLERDDLGGGHPAVERVARAALASSPAGTGRRGRAPSLGSHRGSMVALVRCRLRALYRLARFDEGDALLAAALAAVAPVDLTDAASLLQEPHSAGRWAVVRKQATAVLRRRPNLAFALWIRGAARAKLGQFDAAGRDLAACLGTPSEAHAGFEDAVHDTLAELAIERGAYPQAIDHARDALAIRPDRVQTMELMARALFALDRIEEAERAIDGFIEAAPPGWVLTQSYLLHLLCDEGRHAQALQLAERMLRRARETGDEGLTILARAAMGGRMGARTRQKPLGGRRDPMLALARSRIRALYALGQQQKARNALRSTLRVINDGDLDAGADLLFEAHRAGDTTATVSVASEVLERRPAQAFCLWVRGAALGKLGKTREALEDLRACLQRPAEARQGFDDAVHDTIAEVYLGMGDLNNAAHHARKALAIKPGKPESLATLAACGH